MARTAVEPRLETIRDCMKLYYHCVIVAEQSALENAFEFVSIEFISINFFSFSFFQLTSSTLKVSSR